MSSIHSFRSRHCTGAEMTSVRDRLGPFCGAGMSRQVWQVRVLTVLCVVREFQSANGVDSGVGEYHLAEWGFANKIWLRSGTEMRTQSKWHPL